MIQTIKILILAFVTIVLPLTACAEDNSREFIQNLEQELASLTGVFAQNENNPYFWYGSWSIIEGLRKTVDTHPELLHFAVNTLADCIDNPNPAKATYKGKQILVGAMCMWAASKIVYYEAYDKDGNIVGWEGYVPPDATIDELNRSHKEWQRIVADIAYIQL